MRVVFFSVLFLFGLQTSVIGQVPKGFNAVTNTATVQNSLAASAKATQTITSDFTQVKHMKMLQDKVSSKGKFYFKKEQKLRIEYTSPFQYLMVLNNGQIAIKDGNKTNKVNARNSKAMQSANKVMMDCMTGNVFNNKDFSVKAYETGKQYLLQLSPVNASIKSLFSGIDVYLDKGDNSVAKLVMHENAGDYTEMIFANKQLNLAISDALFTVR